MSQTSRLRGERPLWPGSCLLFEVGLSQLFELGTRVKEWIAAWLLLVLNGTSACQLSSTPITSESISPKDTSGFSRECQAQLLSRYPVLKIQPTSAIHSA